MPRRKTLLIIFFTTLIFYLLFTQDGFAFTLKSRYFNINIHDGIDTFRLLERLNTKHLLHIDTLSSEEYDIKAILKDTLDTLYLEVSDILDIHMYSFEMSLEVLPNRKGLSDLLVRYQIKGIDIPSYYYYQRNTVFISFEDMDAGMLAHEVAHAIISHYFVVPPPPKIQEILCGYVEYSIRKAADN